MGAHLRGWNLMGPKLKGQKLTRPDLRIQDSWDFNWGQESHKTCCIWGGIKIGIGIEGRKNQRDLNWGDKNSKGLALEVQKTLETWIVGTKLTGSEMRGKETHGWVRGTKILRTCIERTKTIVTYTEGTKFTLSELRGQIFTRPELKGQNRMGPELRGTKIHRFFYVCGYKNHRTWNEGTKLLTEPSALRGHHLLVLVPSVRRTWTEMTIK